jgi:type II secretory pathway predicted ATPase ExeA/outer membrane protein OmpA-like peptidoglycan-associated protein
MYTSFYNLHRKPFEMNSGPSFLWSGKNHEKAFSTLRYGILGNKGLLLLTGDAGSGKTILIKAFIQSLGKGDEGVEGVRCALIDDPRLERIDFYNAIARGFGIDATFTSKVQFLLQFSHFLHEAAAENKKVLLLVDDCHLLNQEMLEELRLLSNIEDAGAKLINIFLVGRPEFDDMLLQQKNRAIRQRLTLLAELQSLTVAETDDYIRHRLKVAGTEERLFTAKAVQVIHRFAHGVPFHINVICDRALENGSIHGLRIIDNKLIQSSVQGMDLPTGPFHEDIHAYPDHSDRKFNESRLSENFKPEPVQTPHSFMGSEFLRFILTLINGKKPGVHDNTPWRDTLFSSKKRQWFKYGFSFEGLKILKEEAGLRRLTGLIGILVLFVVGSAFYFSAPHTQVSDLTLPPEIAKNEEIAETENVPGVKGDSEVDTSPIVSVPEENDIENITEKVVESEIADLDKTEISDEVKQEKEDLVAEETITEVPLASETDQPQPITDQLQPIAPVEIRSIIKIEKTVVKKILDQKKKAGNLTMEPKKIILGLRSDSMDLTSEGLQILNSFVEKLEQYPKARLLVKGFVSADSNTPENIKMSEERALSVQKLLLEKGIDVKRIEVVGMGNLEPAASNETVEGRNKNRRVEVSIVDNGK